MATDFTTLPIIDVAPLHSPFPPKNVLQTVSDQLSDAFTTSGFAYLSNAPLTYSEDDVIGLAQEFFRKKDEEKWRLAKRNILPSNKNTYRGYFPVRPGADSLKEGFDIGPAKPLSTQAARQSGKLNLSEPNIWPLTDTSYFRQRSEMLYYELQTLSARLLSLLALSLGKPADHFSDYLQDSLSTLRYLHYPPMIGKERQAVSCEPHTDSGILTLLHQDHTGGLEVLNAANQWIPAPPIPGTIIVNIGDLMARVSGGKFVATRHRVLSAAQGLGRYSVPFFFEPGAACEVKPVDAPHGEGGVIYGEHVLSKMSSWVEFADTDSQGSHGTSSGRPNSTVVEAF